MSEVRSYKLYMPEERDALLGFTVFADSLPTGDIELVNKADYDAALENYNDMRAMYDKAVRELESANLYIEWVNESAADYANRNFGGNEYQIKVRAFEAGMRNEKIESDKLRAENFNLRRVANAIVSRAEAAGLECGDWDEIYYLNEALRRGDEG